MDLRRLFRVLVVGGSMLATKGCGSDSDEAPADAGAPGLDAAVDAAAPGPEAGPEASAPPPVDAPGGDVLEARPLAGDTAAGDAAGDGPPATGKMCFCNTQPACCTSHGDGPRMPAEGIICCWSTRCE